MRTMTVMRICVACAIRTLSVARVFLVRSWTAEKRVLSQALLPFHMEVLVIMAAVLSISCGHAQESKPESARQAVTAPPHVLPGLPRPPDAPASLFPKPVSTPTYACDALPGPYFV